MVAPLWADELFVVEHEPGHHAVAANACGIGAAVVGLVVAFVEVFLLLLPDSFATLVSRKMTLDYPLRLVPELIANQPLQTRH